MIEISRYILAAIVAETHLWADPWGFGRTQWLGNLSVFAFYALSGYLMTRVLNERYGFTPSGTLAFIVNRVLRLWPAYLVLLALSLIALQYLPLGDFHVLIAVPSSPAEIISNLTIIGQVGFDFLQTVTMAKPLITSWSLSIEICCYLLLAFYFARSRARLWGLIALGVIALALSTAWCAQSADPAAYGRYCFQNRYGVIQAGFIPFGFGGLYYFHREGFGRWFTRRRLFFIVSVVILAFLVNRSRPLMATLGPFVGIPAMWALLAAAGDARPAALQDFIGRASYHLFIVHLPLGAFLVTGFDLPEGTALLYLATLVGALALSAFLVPMEHRIDKLRQRVALAAHPPRPRSV